MTISGIDRDKDSICALATAHGIGAISVLRISGARAAEITRKIAAFLPENPESHKVYYGILKAADSGLALDEVLVSYFAPGRSFTGEATCEISCHGSETVVNEILRQLVLAGARPAERGEFTYRAFMNGRVDLVQAESVLAMIESRSPRAARLALRQLQGDVSRRLKSIVDELTWVLANLEANIDFAAEDIVVADNGALAKRLERALAETRRLLGSYKQGRLVREGLQVALVGAPNVGKSSLLNALAGEDRAIVTAIAGTTRDLIEAELICEGLRCTLVDTAGLRHTDDPVERIGVQRTLEKMAQVDLVFYVIDATALDGGREFVEHLPWDKTAIVINKTDLCDVLPAVDKRALASLPVSALSGRGLGEITAWLQGYLRREISEDSTLLSNARHFRGMEIVRESLERTLRLLGNEESPDLIALELQTSLKALYEILGMVYDDQVMDRVFAEFCLGK